jgi:hypothetical protein
MTFLNPAILVGLIAAAIPILLHLLNLRKLRTVEFSTLAFLKQLQKSKMRRLKLRQILLLILRTLVIASVVLAFARPAIQSTASGGFGTRAKPTAVLLLDDSFSMAAADERGVLINQAKSAALRLLSTLREGDEVFFQKFSDAGRREAREEVSHNLSAVVSAVNETKVSTTFHSLNEILHSAGGILQSSRNFNKELYLITDLQRTNFIPDEATKKKESLAENLGKETKLFLVPIGRTSVANVALEKVSIPNRIFEKDRPFSVEATIRNYGNTPLRNYTASLYLDGKRVMQKSVDLGAEAAANVTLTGVPKRAGHIGGYVQLEADALDADNERYFTSFVPERSDILFVTAAGRDIRFVTLALTADERSRSAYAIETISPSKLLSTPLSQFDVVVISNVKSFTASEVERLKRFVEAGGGIILFPGPDMERSQYNSELCRALNIAPFVGVSGNSSDRQSFVTFASIDEAHPLFSGMFEESQGTKKKRKPAVESPQIFLSVEFRPGANGQSIIQLSNGNSFLTEYRIGNGGMLVFAVAPTLDWSNFPTKGIFVPLLRRSVAYLAALHERPSDHFAGEAVTVTISSKALGKGESSGLVHQLPDGQEEIIQPTTSGVGAGDRVFVIKNTQTVGVHAMVQNKETVAVFAVNTDPRESDVRRLSVEEATRWLVERGLESRSIRILNPNEAPEEVLLQSRFGVELWKYFIGLALVCALAEMIVARHSRKEGEAIEA